PRYTVVDSVATSEYMCCGFNVGGEYQRVDIGQSGRMQVADVHAQANQHDTNGNGRGFAGRLRHSGTTRATGCSAAATSGLRSGSVKGAASISKTSPGCV